MGKRFPSIRLSGDKDAAATYIRESKTFLFKTKAVRDQMGVPVYQQEYEVDERTTIRILLSGEQEFIYIFTKPLEEVAEEKGEEEEKEEEEYCYPGFIFYDNISGYNESTQRNTGYHLYYTGSKWKVSSNESPWGYSAAWFGVADLYDDYYDKEGIEKCSIITWKGMGSGGLGPTYDPYLDKVGTYGTYRSSFIAIAGQGYAIGYEVLGTCFLPNTTDEKDYFYSLVYQKYDREFGEAFHIYRHEKQAGIFGPDTGSKITVASFTWQDLNAELNLATGRFLRPFGVAFIDNTGKASLTLQIGETTGSSENSVFPWSSYVYSTRDPLLQYGVFGTIYLPVVAEFDLVKGTATFVRGCDISTAVCGYTKWSFEKDKSVVGQRLYGDLDWGTVGGENDYLKLIDNGAGGYTVSYKPSAAQVYRRSQQVVLEEASTSNTEMHVCFVGGCEDKIEYRVSVEHPEDRAYLSGGTTQVLKDYNPDYPPGIESVPMYLASYAAEYSGTTYKVHLRQYKNDVLSKSFTLFEYQTDPTSSSLQRLKNNATFTYLHVLSQPYDSSSLLTLPADVIVPVNVDSVTWNMNTPSGSFGWEIGTRINYGRMNARIVRRAIVYHHPSINYLSYLESERNCIAGVGQSATLSYRVDYNGEIKTLWSISGASTDTKGYAGTNLHMGPFWPYTDGTPPSASAWEIKVDVGASSEYKATVVGNWYRGSPSIRFNSLMAWFLVTNWDWAFAMGYHNSSSTTLDLGKEYAACRVLTPNSLSDNDKASEFIAVHRKGYGPNTGDIPAFVAFFVHPRVSSDVLDPNADPEDVFSACCSVRLGATDLDGPCFIPVLDSSALPEEAEFVSNVLTLEQVQQLIAEYEGGLEELFPKDLPVDFGVI